MAEELSSVMPGQPKGLNPAKRWAMPVNRINVEHCIPLEGAVAQERGVSVVCTTQKQHRLCAQGAAVRKRPYSLALECCWLGQVLRECVRIGPKIVIALSFYDHPI